MGVAILYSSSFLTPRLYVTTSNWSSHHTWNHIHFSLRYEDEFWNSDLDPLSSLSLSSDDNRDMPSREMDRFGIQPYQFEPRASDASSEVEDVQEAAAADGQHTLTKSDW